MYGGANEAITMALQKFSSPGYLTVPSLPRLALYALAFVPTLKRKADRIAFLHRSDHIVTGQFSSTFFFAMGFDDVEQH